MVFSAAGFARVFLEKRLELKSLKRQTKAEEEGTDHVLASHTTFFNFQVHRSDFVHVTTRTSHHDGFIEIGAGFTVHGFSLFPARRFFYNGFSCWIQFNRRTSENHYVFTRTKKAVLQFL